VKHSQASIDRAHEQIGFTPKVDFRDGLRQTVEFFRDASDA
jgi:nucleoside-diphosphate-sugar epimerase